MLRIWKNGFQFFHYLFRWHSNVFRFGKFGICNNLAEYVLFVDKNL